MSVNPNDGKAILATVNSILSDTKIGDWRPCINVDDAVRMAEAEKLRDAAEMVIGYCHIDPMRSVITRKQIKKATAMENMRASMSPQERATRDLIKARTEAEIEIMRREGLTFGQMHEIAKSLPV